MPALLAILSACALPTAVEGLSTAPVQVYVFTVEGRFTTRVEGAASPVEVPGPWALALRGRVEQQRARGFRDGSEGLLLRFADVERRVDEGPWEAASLDGRSVELRVFDNGEILDLYEGEHVAGPGRHLDTFDLLLPALSPVVPLVERGESAWRRASWPFGVSRERQLRSTLSATWTHEEAVSLPQGRSVRMVYEGSLEGRGRELAGQAQLSLTGRAEGEVFMRSADARMVQHTLRWSRRLQAALEPSGALLVQDQDFTARLDLESER